MAKEMNVYCNFPKNSLTCILPEHTMDVMLKVRTRSGEHTSREDVYTRTLKYRRWNNELQPFCSFKERVANMFWKRNSLSDSSRGTSTQTIVNNMDNNVEENKAEVTDNDSNRDSDRDSIHSNWRKLMTVKSGMNINASTSNTSLGEAVKINAQPRKRAVKNIVLVPYKPKPKDWGSWKIKSPYATSTIASTPLISNENIQIMRWPMFHIAHITLQFTLQSFMVMSKIS